MNNREFLDILGEIDADLVDEAAPRRDAALPRKSTRKYKNIAAIAACFALIVGASLLAKPIFDAINDLNVNDPSQGEPSGGVENSDSNGGVNDTEEALKGDDENDEVGGQEPNDGDYFAPVEDESGEAQEVSTNPELSTNAEAIEPYPPVGEDEGECDSELCTEMVEPDWAFTAEISDERFSDYELTGERCAPELVGEKLGEMNILVRLGEESATVSAEVYKIADVDVKLSLCIRYIDDGYDDFYRGFLDFDAYFTAFSGAYAFESFAQMRDTVLGGGELVLPNSYNYYLRTDAMYPESFYVSVAYLGGLREMIFGLDGDAVDTQGGIMLESVHAEADEWVRISCRFDGDIGSIPGEMYVYGTGYLSHSAFGGQLFVIGEENAREIIDHVLAKGEPEGYIWSDKDGAWYPVGADEDAEYSSFADALIENKLMDQLYFVGEVGYTSTLYDGNHPNKLYLGEKFCLIVADVLYAADGPAIAIEDITKLAGEAIILTHVYGDESRNLTVYDSGHVELDGHYYFIETSYTDKILSTVRANCSAESGYYWDRSEKKWKIDGSGDAGNEDTEETAPEDSSVDVGYGSDVYETEIEYDYDY